MRIYFTAILLFISSTLVAQYTTPGTGVNWDLDMLEINSEGIIGTSGFYDDLIISLNDTITISNSELWYEAEVLITVFGHLNIDGCVFWTEGSEFQGFRLEESSHVYFYNNIIENCGGIKVLTPNFIFDFNTVAGSISTTTSGGFIELSTGKPIIENNVFIDCSASAISSAANAAVAPIIEDNEFISNVLENSNRPQINLGPSGAADTTKILYNEIGSNNVNEMVGGIAFSSLIGGDGNIIIQGNTIRDNRYGIAIIGNGLSALIDNNTILDNNIQNLPNLGGSGINLNGNETSFAVLSNNTIEDNLWGVTVQGTFNVAMGDNDFVQTSPGGNRFSNNGNGGELYALYNNTPNDISAMHNCWETSLEPTLEIAESVIAHVIDDSSLGEVFFNPMGLDCAPDGIEDHEKLEASIEIYPNPSETDVTVSWSDSNTFSDLKVYSINGQLIAVDFILQNQSLILESSKLDPGFYLLQLNFAGLEVSKKLIVH